MLSASAISASAATNQASSNPLLQPWSSQPFSLPPFKLVSPSHFEDAFAFGMEEHLADLQSIVDDDTEASFESVIARFDRAGSTFSKVASIFSNLCSSKNTDELKEVQHREREQAKQMRNLQTELQSTRDRYRREEADKSQLAMQNLERSVEAKEKARSAAASELVTLRAQLAAGGQTTKTHTPGLLSAAGLRWPTGNRGIWFPSPSRTSSTMQKRRLVLGGGMRGRDEDKAHTMNTN